MMHQSPHMSMAGSMSNTPVPEGRGLVPPSPHLGQAPSPASNNLQAPGQPPQQLSLSNPSSSQNSTTVGSANTSPNQANKRRRPSSTQVKNEADGDGGNGGGGGGVGVGVGMEGMNLPGKLGVKPSPRMQNNNKRMKHSPTS